MDAATYFNGGVSMEYEGGDWSDGRTYDGPDLRRRYYPSWKDRERALAAGLGNEPCKGKRARRERQRRDARRKAGRA